MDTEGKTSGTKYTITTVAMFHTEMKLAKAEKCNHLLNTSPWATLHVQSGRLGMVSLNTMQPDHNKWNTATFTTQLGQQTRE